jgi:hypothetical protein
LKSANDVPVTHPAVVYVTLSADSSEPATTALTVILKDQALVMSALMEHYELGYPIHSVEQPTMQDQPA